jgi:hypothetical protein
MNDSLAPAPKSRWSALGTLAGCLTIAGLALIAVALWGHRGPDWRSLLWFNLLCLGAACTFVGGIFWVHTPAKRKLKTAFLGLLCGTTGAVFGVLLGDQVQGSGGRWEWEFWASVAGFWIGAILFGWFGIWWGMKVTRWLSAPCSTSPPPD